MPLSEDLSIFFGDFAVTCTAGAVTGLGILDMPTEIVADGVVLTTDYRLTCLASDFGSLSYTSPITVDGTAYTVRETTLIDDGKFCVLMLSRT